MHNYKCLHDTCRPLKACPNQENTAHGSAEEAELQHLNDDEAPSSAVAAKLRMDSFGVVPFRTLPRTHACQDSAGSISAASIEPIDEGQPSGINKAHPAAHHSGDMPQQLYQSPTIAKLKKRFNRFNPAMPNASFLKYGEATVSASLSRVCCSTNHKQHRNGLVLPSGLVGLSRPAHGDSQ
eukprot:9503812-Pyramimonas_sp.AAC.1